uniref:Uncharacterized protein n=1 Tax=Arundo donax TaxID=35708 RepID=A0A0A9EBA5_ARUDO
MNFLSHYATRSAYHPAALSTSTAPYSVPPPQVRFPRRLTSSPYCAYPRVDVAGKPAPPALAHDYGQEDHHPLPIFASW